MNPDQAYPYEERSYYPHLLPEDVVLWNRFIGGHPEFFSLVMYDVHVGGQIGRLEHWTDEEYAAASSLAAKRIDVVGVREGELWIVELKPDAGLGALGQILCYVALYRRDVVPSVRLQGCLITNNLTLDESWLCGEFGVVAFQV